MSWMQIGKIFSKKKETRFNFVQKCVGRNGTRVLPELKYQRFCLENIFKEYFEAKYRNIKEILRRKKKTRFNLGQKCQINNFFRNKISIFNRKLVHIIFRSPKYN